VETVQTNPSLPPSVNNFAYHVSLETPPDAWGKNNINQHSGYTEAQYDSLAWLIAQSQVPDDRITTHRAVDVAGRKVDPLSFDSNKFFEKLHSFRQLKTFNNANNDVSE
jgi:N-acetyl-anhydromuramyl-L-alanine amidase AmpD